MNRQLFAPAPVPWGAPFVYAAGVGVSVFAATAIGGGMLAGFGPGFAATALSLTLFSGIHLSRQPVTQAEPAQVIPTPKPEPPANFRAMPFETQSVDTGRVWLDMGARVVSVKLTRGQLLYWAEQIQAGEMGIVYRLYYGDSPFQRADVDRLRIFCPDHNLATRRGKRVTLTSEAARAIVAATTRPPGTIRA